MGARMVAAVSLLVAMPLFGVAGLGSLLPPETCLGASEEDFEHGFVVVSGDGLAPDDLLGVDEDYTVWTPEQYLCVYPPPVEMPSEDITPSCLRDDVMQNVTATPEEQVMLCNPMNTEPAELPDVGPHPHASEAPDGAEAVTASAGVGKGWRHMGSSIALKVNVLSPVMGNVPNDKCHWQNMEDGTNSLEGDLGHRINQYCYLFTFSTAASNKNPDGSWRAWNPCFNPGTGNTNDCTTNVKTLAQRLRTHVSTQVWTKDCPTCLPRYYLADQVSEVTLGFVRNGGNNGIVDDIDGWTAIVSEKTQQGDWDNEWDWGETAIVKHELSHLLSARHFPDEGWRVKVCNWPHWHGYYDHWHSTQSVMNFCHAGLHGYLGWGADPNNLRTIRDNANDWTSCNTSGALKPYPGTCL